MWGRNVTVWHSIPCKRPRNGGFVSSVSELRLEVLCGELGEAYTKDSRAALQIEKYFVSIDFMQALKRCLKYILPYRLPFLFTNQITVKQFHT